MWFFILSFISSCSKILKQSFTHHFSRSYFYNADSGQLKKKGEVEEMLNSSFFSGNRDTWYPSSKADICWIFVKINCNYINLVSVHRVHVDSQAPWNKPKPILVCLLHTSLKWMGQSINPTVLWLSRIQPFSSVLMPLLSLVTFVIDLVLQCSDSGS